MSFDLILNFFYSLTQSGIKIWIQDNNIELLVPDNINLQASQKNFIKINRDEIFACLQENNVYSSKYNTLIIKNKNKTSDLSFSQGRFWFIEKYEQGTNAYNVPMIYKLSTHADKEFLNESIISVIKRHEVLRTFIKETQDGVGYQEVSDFQEKFFGSKKITVESMEELDERIEAESNRAFDLENEYPIRVCFYELDDLSTEQNENYVSIVVHHIAFDGWSLDIFWKELHAYYNYYVQQKKGTTVNLNLPELTIQYKDFALWQRNYLSGERLDTQLSYWLDKLIGYEPLTLITDKPRPPEFDYTGRDIYFQLDKEKSDSLRDLAKKLDVSLYSVFLSAYYLMLRGYTNQDDIIIGTSIANRHYAQTTELIGPFMNSLAMRKKIDPNILITDFIKEIGKQVNDSQSNQDLPFEKLVENLHTEKDSSRHPIFQIMFAMQEIRNNQINDKKNLETLLDEYGLKKGLYKIAKHDISMFLDDGSPCLKGIFNYAVSLFNAETINEFIETYIHILDQFIELKDNEILSSRTKVSKLKYLNPKKYQEVIHEWNQVEKKYPKNNSIHYLFEQQVKQHPNEIAVRFKNIELTYNELNERANQFANYLRQSFDIQPDSLVLLHLDRSELMVIAIFGILKAGGAYVPIDHNYPSERIKYIIEDTKAKLFITDKLHKQNFKEIYSQIELLIADDELVQQNLARQSKENYDLIVQSNNLAYVIYTSGTTGTPKGVMIEHAGVVNYIFNVKHHVGISRKDRVDFSTSISFDLTVTNLISSLCLGATVVVYSGDVHNLNEYKKHLVVEKINVVKLTPSYFKLIIDSLNITSINRVILGGEKLNHNIINALTPHNENNKLKIFDEYGPTEATVGTCNSIVYPDYNYSIGKLYYNYKAYVLNSSLQPVPIGGIGELHIGGIGLARGYLNQPKLTAEKFIDNPFQGEEEKISGCNDRLYKTGDLVRWLQDGNMEYIGRNDFQVKIRGHRIELGEIEFILEKHGDVTQAAVIAKNTPAHDTRLIAYIIPSEFTPSSTELKGFLLDYLPGYMIPADIVILEELPLTSNGKLDKSALPDLKQISQDNYQAPRNQKEIMMCKIWADVFGLPLEKIGIHDNFFDLGGHSILAIRLASKISQELRISLNVSIIFRHSTIDKLMTYLENITKNIKGQKYAF